MKIITLQRPYLGMKAGTECHQVSRFTAPSGGDFIRFARADRKPIKTNFGKELETTISADHFDMEVEKAA